MTGTDTTARDAAGVRVTVKRYDGTSLSGIARMFDGSRWRTFTHCCDVDGRRFILLTDTRGELPSMGVRPDGSRLVAGILADGRMSRVQTVLDGLHGCMEPSEVLPLYSAMPF